MFPWVKGQTKSWREGWPRPVDHLSQNWCWVLIRTTPPGQEVGVSEDYSPGLAHTTDKEFGEGRGGQGEQGHAGELIKAREQKKLRTRKDDIHLGVVPWSGPSSMIGEYSVGWSSLTFAWSRVEEMKHKHMVEKVFHKQCAGDVRLFVYIQDYLFQPWPCPSKEVVGSGDI